MMMEIGNKYYDDNFNNKIVLCLQIMMDINAW